MSSRRGHRFATSIGMVAGLLLALAVAAALVAVALTPGAVEFAILVAVFGFVAVFAARRIAHSRELRHRR